MRKNKQILFNAGLSDIIPETAEVRYNDDELIIFDDVRKLSDFSSYKISFNFVFSCMSGRIQFRIGNEQVAIHADQVIVAHSHVTLEDFMTSPDAVCGLLCVNDRVLKEILREQISIWNNALYQRHYAIFEVNPKGRRVWQQMEYALQFEKSIFRQQIVFSMLRAAFLKLCEELLNLTTDDAQNKHDPNSRATLLFHNFLKNIQKRKVKKLHVADYANELCITSKYLSSVCQKVSGKPPIEWIAEYVVQDIAYYLRNTDLSAKEISTELGFPNPSFFGKFVRDHLGCTPTEFRQKAVAGE